jgi:hypothetical protein
VVIGEIITYSSFLVGYYDQGRGPALVLCSTTIWKNPYGIDMLVLHPIFGRDRNKGIHTTLIRKEIRWSEKHMEANKLSGFPLVSEEPYAILNNGLLILAIITS